MNLSRLSGSGGGALELDIVLFLFTGTAFLGTIKNEGRGFGNTGFWREDKRSGGVRTKNQTFGIYL